MNIDISKRKIQIHSHRGARGVFPENTLRGFSYALSIGVHAVEMDISMCADGTFVVYHDLTLNPLTTRDHNGNWVNELTPIIELSYNQLSEYDVGTIRHDTDYARAFNLQRSLEKARIPKLTEVIELVVNSDKSVILNIELKSNPDQPGLVPAVDEYIDRLLTTLIPYSLGPRLFVQSFDWRLVRLLKQRNKSIKTGCLSDQQTDAHPFSPHPHRATEWTDGLCMADFGGSLPLMLIEIGCDVWSSRYLDLTRESVSKAHQQHLEVSAWTVNEPEAMHDMIDWGVDAITTDYPDRMLQIVDSK